MEERHVIMRGRKVADERWNNDRKAEGGLSDGTTAREFKILRISATRALMLEPGTIAKKRKEKRDEERLSDLEATE